MKELRTMQYEGRTLHFNVDVADVAEVLLGENDEVLARARLRDLWAEIAPDLRDGATRERRAKGRTSSHVLKNCLERLEKADAVRRYGTGPLAAVVILDRDLLQAIVDLWA